MEHLLAKEGVAGSIPVSRFYFFKRLSISGSRFFVLSFTLLLSQLIRILNPVNPAQGVIDPLF